MQHIWLESVVAAYLDAVEEREFDAPFLTLLGALGYTDIHYLHGQAEFGKDFIAKKIAEDGRLEQWAFQTKAGNLGMPEWRQARYQIDEMRRSSLAHPGFDPELPRRAVLVTTGILNGQAPVDAQDYKGSLERAGETTFDLWDKSDLLKMLVDAPEIGLAGAPDFDLLRFLADIEAHNVDESRLEAFSRRWMAPHPGTLQRGALEACVVGQRLRVDDQLDMSALAAIALLRATAFAHHADAALTDVAARVAEVARLQFDYYAGLLWARCDERTLEPRSLLREHGGFATYPARCMRVMEVLSLYCLVPDRSDAERDALREFIVEFVRCQPGTAHPISDKWAVSITPTALILAGTDKELLVRFLTDVLRWLLRFYEAGGFGLAGPYADATSEVRYLIGAPLEHVEFQPRRQSYVAAVLLDLASVLELVEFYELVLNDLTATEVPAWLVEANDDTAQYQIDAGGLVVQGGARYWAAPSEGSWHRADHHVRAVDCLLVREGRAWDHLALSSLLRDRHSVSTLRSIAEVIDPTLR